MKQTYDVVVVGGGAAGLAGAVALARSRRSVLVVDAGEPRNAPAAAVHNFLTRDGTPPSEIYAAGRAEVAKYGGHVETGRVTRLSRDGERFTVQIGGRAVTARRLLAATGLRDELPPTRPCCSGSSARMSPCWPTPPCSLPGSSESSSPRSA